MANPSRPEPMNATTHHPKVIVSLTLGEPYFVAGDYISGKMEMDCKADKGLGIGVILIELFATQALTSRDHSARSTFIHARRLFQSPGLPPSNAVQAHPLPGDPPLPPHYHQAKRGHSTFLFRIPLPATSPSSISFGSGLASVKYEIRASVGAYWKGERQLVTDKKDADVVEAYDEERIGREEPEVTVVGENGKIWCQARLVGGILIAGESACIELQVKNHSVKKNTGLSISLNRSLHLPNLPADEKPLQISDTVTTVPFREPEYIIPPGVEGVASLVFDVPKPTKGVRGGLLVGDESEALGKNGKGPKTTQGLFEVNCVIAVKMIMGFGNKDILIEIPAVVVHPSALPEVPEQYPGYRYYDQQQVYETVSQAPYIAHTPLVPVSSQSPHSLDQAQTQDAYVPYPALPWSPGPSLATGAYVDPNQNLVWLPPPIPFVPTTTTPQPYQQPYHYPYVPPQSHTQYTMNLETSMPYIHDDSVSILSPLRPASAGLVSSSTATATAALLSPPLPGLPGLPPSSTHEDFTSMLSSGLSSAQHIHSQVLPSNNSPSRADIGRYSGNIAPEEAPVRTDHPGEEGTGHRAPRIAQILRVTSQAQGRGRSASPIGGRRYPIGGAGDGPTSTARPTLSPLPPLDLNLNPDTLQTVLHSPRPVLSPKRSFTKVTEVTNGGGMISKSVPKSDRVKELEKMADEVGTMARDLSADLPPGDKKGIDSDAEEPPPVPTMTDKARFLSSKPRIDDYFSIVPGPSRSVLDAPVSPNKVHTKDNLAAPSSFTNTQPHYSQTPSLSRPRSRSRTPPTPATPTLIAVATPRKPIANGYDKGFSTKVMKATNGKGKAGNGKSLLGLGLAVEGRAESGLDALERKLLAEVGTRKVVDEKRPDIWSVLGSGGERTLSHTSGSGPGSGVGAEKTEKPSPIEIPRRDSDRDPLNDSAISSLTLPDCGDIGPAVVDAQLGMSSVWKTTVTMDPEEKHQGSINVELDRDRDSDEKTHKGGLGSKKDKKKKKNSSRGTLKDGQDSKEGRDENETREEKKEKEKKSGKKKGSDRSSASKGRVAAWLGGIEAEPPLDDVISASPSPRPSKTIQLPSEIETPSSVTPIKSEDHSESKEKIPFKTSEPTDSTPIPDPRSSGFVPIGTLKRDIYQRTLVPKDSPMASTNPSEDARRITDIWNHRDTVKHNGAGHSSNETLDNMAKNPWQSVVGKGKLSVPLKPSDPEVKYDIRSARGGKGGRVTAVAAIWASGSANSNSKKPAANSPLSSSYPSKPSKAAGKMSSTLSVPKLPVSTSSSSSSTSGDGIVGRRATRARPNVGVGVKVASAPVPAVISSSHAKPTLSTTASLARPVTSADAASAGTRKALPIKVPPTISEFPSGVRLGGKSSDLTSNGKVGKISSGLEAGKAANAVTNSRAKTTNIPTSGERLAFGQARLRDLIKKYQG
ncbi:hypothetical protein J3R30DRAFT_2722861 [Lentinula aciculospora]|uniref:Arrestin C-terminal-like domain-containing protein n=1 Tax=Lentinula aciculospora TaxID=153920 RepID=A0A9W9ABU5_9AGAR|nr:hypothetical protein J3R30DRAFT_2722861 [Lentinula aciculospora]